MKTTKTTIIAALFAVLLCASATARAATSSELLQRGLYAEEVEGNLAAAITNYAAVVSNRGATPAQIAQALYRQGMCCVKVKDEAAARTALQRLVSDYPDQADLADKARALLEDLTNFDPATLMPPNTLLYLELGRPGYQIETLVTMLKGTPFENPLAAVSGGAPAGNGDPSPANLVAALLNPSMLAEFKKIRSSAIGVTALHKDGPPSCIAVLYPGKSDALRGILLAALGVAGKAGQPIEGLQTVTIQDMVGIAYDDKVVIAAQPASQLAWSVKQYKGTSNDATLATRNAAFSKLSRKQRQDDLLTLWVKADEAYARAIHLMPQGQVPRELLTANALADFRNMDSMNVSVSLRTDGLALQSRVLFKDKHQSLVYDLIHTPNLSPRALAAAPSDAIALASVALNPSDRNHADAARAGLRRATGLDFGRELFSNVEQITLFMVPSAGKGDPKLALLRSIGIAITSRNPAQTRELLSRLLSVPHVVQGGEVAAGTAKFKLATGPQGEDVQAFVEQVNGTTLLAANAGVMEKAVAALKQSKSAMQSGALSKPLAQVQPGASKLLIANIGGLVRLVAEHSNFGNMSPEKIAELERQIDQLAKATQRASLQLRTDEQPNELAAVVCVEGLPPLSDIIAPMHAISEISKQAEAESLAASLRRQMPAVIAPASSAPAIDGNVDAAWGSARPCAVAQVSYEKPSSTNDLSARHRLLWDENNLYVLVEVADDVLRRDHDAENWYQDDGVEIYIDATNAKSGQYGATDYQYAFHWDAQRPAIREVKHQRTEGVDFAMAKTASGYRLEAKFPWQTIGGKPSAGAQIGLDIQVNDNDSGKRDSKLAWHDQKDVAWNNPQAFGNAVLGGIVGWWKFDEESGTVALDSSGGNHNGAAVGEIGRKPGKLGGAIDFNGHSFVKVPKSAAFDMADQVTLACWMNLRSVPAAWSAVISKGDTAWRLSTVDREPRLHFGVHSAWEENSRLDSPAAIAPNSWHHVAATYSGDEMRLYIDGKQAAVQKRSGPIGKNSFDVLIGGNAEQKGREFDGLLDDVRIYNYALPERDVQSLAQLP